MGDAFVTNVGSFELIRELGSGEWGDVWLARDLRQGQEVALKILKLSESTNLDQFKSEFRLLAELRHPNLARVYDLGRESTKGRPFFTSEYCRGQDLFKATESKPMPYLEEIFVQILMALDYIHHEGVIHFDIKPTNILVGEDHGSPRVKLVDFGLAAKWTSLPQRQWGTLATMAPEILTQGHFIDHRADLYSLGMVMLYTLTRRWPFDVTKPQKVLHWHLKESLLDTFWEGGEEAPLYFREVVGKLLNKNPAERFSQAKTVLNFLNLATDRKYASYENQLHLKIPADGPLVEREEILAQIKKYSDQILSASEEKPISQILTIFGEKGIGKTRLLEEMSYYLQLQDISLYKIQCHWRSRIWEELKQIGKKEGELDLSHLHFESTLGEEESSDVAQWPLRQLVHDLIVTARHKPFCLMIDDFHKADEETIQLLQRLQERIDFERKEGKQIPLLVLLTSEKEVLHSLKPPRLSRKGILQYVRLVLGEVTLMDGITDLLYTYSGGLPLLVMEGLRYLVPYLQTNSLPDQLPAPQKGLLYKNTLEKLGEEERSILALLSLLSRSIKETDLAILAGCDASTLHDSTQRLVRLGLVNKSLSPPAYQVSSGALMLDVLASMKETEKRTLHGKIAEGLEKIAYVSFEEKAHHWEGAGRSKEALQYYQQAGAHLKSKGQISSAAHCLIQALPLCQKGSQDWENLILEITRLLIYSSRYEEAEDYLNLLANHPPSVNQQEVAGWLDFKRRRFTEAQHHYERALKLLHGEHKVKQILLKNALANIALQMGDLSQSVQIFEESLHLEKKIPETALLQITNNQLGLVLAMTGEMDKAIGFFQERLKLFEEKKLYAQAVPIYNAMGFVYLKASRYQQAIQFLQKALALSEKMGVFHVIFSVMGNLITAFVKEGRFADCFPVLEKMLRYQERLGTPRDISYNLLRQGGIYLTLGVEEAARKNFERGLCLARDLKDEHLTGWFLLMQGYLEMEMGDYGASRKYFEECMKIVNDREVPEIMAWIRYAEAHIQCEDNKFDEASKSLSLIPQGLSDEEFSIRLELLKLKINVHLHEPSEEYEKQFEEMERLCLRKNFKELLWQVYDAWGEYEKICVRPEKSKLFFNKGIDVIESVALSLPEEYRDRYKRQKFRQKLYKQIHITEKPKIVFTYGTIQRNVSSKKEGSMMEEKTYSILLDVNKKMVTEHDPKKLLEFIMDVAIELSGAEEGLLLLLNEQNQFEARIARNINKEDLEAVRFSNTIAQEVIQTGQPIFSLNIAEDRKLSAFKSVTLKGLKTVACVPLRFQNRSLGVIYLDTQQSSSLVHDILPLLEAFADQAALSLQNAIAFQRTKEDNIQLEDDLTRTREILEKKELQLHELEALASSKTRATTYPYEQIIGRSRKMEEVLKTMDKITNAHVPVFIYGETGTGKELIARALHQNSLRKKHEFVAINCSAFTETVLESELFGYQKGAFTGADRDRGGLFEKAHQGTLFLDEVADMSVTMQAKVLRAVQEQEILRIGGRTPIKINVRIVSASNKDIKEEVKQSRFREDLYFRITGMTLRLPPLRERKEDIPLLVRHFLEKIKNENNLSKNVRITREAMSRVMDYHWPGNIRELEQCLTNACFLAEGGAIAPEHLFLQEELYPRQNVDEVIRGDHIFWNPEKTMDDYERDIIVKTLEHCRGNKSEAARRLGVSRLTLHNKVKSYGSGH